MSNSGSTQSSLGMRRTPKPSWLQDAQIVTTGPIVDAVYHGGTYDQYNLGCSICIEVICRRIQSIVDAYSNPGRIDFMQARHFVGTGSLEDAIDPALKTTSLARARTRPRSRTLEIRIGRSSLLLGRRPRQLPPTPAPLGPPNRSARLGRRGPGRLTHEDQ